MALGSKHVEIDLTIGDSDDDASVPVSLAWLSAPTSTRTNVTVPTTASNLHSDIDLTAGDSDDDDSAPETEAVSTDKAAKQELVYPDFQVGPIYESSPSLHNPSRVLTSTQVSTTCCLLELPAELRTIIFQMALSQDSGEVVIDLVRQSGSSTRNAFALTEISKQIRHECGDMLYHFNTITFNANKLSGWSFETSRSCTSILAKQMETKKLRAVKIHLGMIRPGRDFLGASQIVTQKSDNSSGGL